MTDRTDTMADLLAAERRRKYGPGLPLKTLSEVRARYVPVPGPWLRNAVPPQTFTPPKIVPRPPWRFRRVRHLPTTD